MTSRLFAEHRGYLSDVHRLRAFERALERAVRPGARVLDLGSGTGILGLLALRAGAGHVYGVDGSPMVGVARAVLRANGLDGRATFVRAHSQHVELPEPVEVVVADQLGPFGVEAGLFEAFADARARHLAPGGRLVPGRVDLVVAPVEDEERWAEVAFWDEPVAGVDLTPLAPLARNVRYFTTVEAGQLLGPGAVVASADPGQPGALPLRGSVVLAVERPGRLHGLAGWFEAELVPGVGLTSSPLAPDRIARSHVVLPLDAPVAVAPGATVEATVVVGSHEGAHRWEVAVRDEEGAPLARSRHATAEGLPLAREDLARTRPDHRPRLTPSTAARATLLSLCDGTRTLAQLEEALLARHPDQFPDRAAAGAFAVRMLDGATL